VSSDGGSTLGADVKVAVLSAESAAQPGGPRRGAGWHVPRKSAGVDGSTTDRRLPAQRSRWLLWLGPALIGALAVTWGLARVRAALPAVERDEAELARVTREVIVERVSGPGRLVPRHVRWLTATHRARVEQVLVEPGDRVEANTRVAVLRNPDMDLALLQAERDLAAARIQMAGTRRQLSALSDDVQLSLAAAREQAKVAEDHEGRTLQMEADGLAPASERVRAASSARELGGRVTLLEQRAATLARERPLELEPGEALVASLEKVVAHQQRELAELAMMSGAAGVVHSVSIEPGQWVESGFVLAKVIVSTELCAELAIDELEARRVSLGQAATIMAGSARFAGHVSRIDPMASRGAVSVEVTFEAEQAGLRADQRVSGEVEVRRYPEALSLKAPVQVTRAGHFAVYKLVEADILSIVDTELVPATGGRVLVRSGLVEGDQVVISDLTRFKDHDRLALR